jgi:tripartite-type tricarboxylate transporter receptor subunit TctC
MVKKRLILGALAIFAGLFAAAGAKGVAAETPYYQGKTITILEGRSPGGTGSIKTQTALKFVLKYLPGNPSVVYQFMPGAGGISAVNHVIHVAPRDGLTIGGVSSAIVSSVITGAPGIRFRLEDIRWLGTGSPGSPTGLVIRPELGIDSIEKLKAHNGLRFAQRSVGHTMYIRDRLAAFVLELKDPKWILGYGSQEIPLALERGEADAQSGGIPGLMRDVPHWFKQGFTAPVVLRNPKGEGAERYPGFPQGRPGVDQFADTEVKKAMLRIYDATNLGSAFFVSKEIPAPALKALNEAFSRAWKDPQFAEEHLRLTQEAADPISGDELHQLLAQVPKDPKTIEAYKQLVGGGPLPPIR